MNIVLFSSASPSDIGRLIDRIHREVPEARVRGVLYERLPKKNVKKRLSGFATNLADPDFWPYFVGRLATVSGRYASDLGTRALRLLHASGPADLPHKSIDEVCRASGCALRITRNFHSEDSLQFVQELSPDLGIVYATRILKPCLFSIPRLGSINIHKRKVPDYRGGGPVGLWELLEDQTEIGATVHQVTDKLDAGAVLNSATIPIEPYDNLTSLALKAHVIGNDLIIRTIADYVRGSLTLRPQPQGAGRMFKNPSPQLLARYKRELGRRRPAFKPARTRSTLKLLARTVINAPRIAVRNWRWRKRSSFPVTILFHHVVSDRPHRMGISTEYFLKHVKFLQKHYRIVSLVRAIEILQTGSVTEPTVVLTFDDGYGDNYINLRAVVERTGVPVTMFVSTDHISTGRSFQHDVRRGIDGFTPLTWEQVKHMRSLGFEIGSHTRTHFDCGVTDRALLRDEIQGSREDLAARLGETVDLFSFPWGLPSNMSMEAIVTASEAYQHICSAFGGYNFGRKNGTVLHLKRWPHPNSLWLLELQLQDALEKEPAAPELDGILKECETKRKASNSSREAAA